MMGALFVGGTMPTDYWAMEPPCRDTRQPRRNPSAKIGLLCPFLQITGTHAQYWMTAQSRAGAMVVGRLGNGLATNSLTPTQTSTLGQGRTAVSISTGTYHTCATRRRVSRVLGVQPIRPVGGWG